MKDPPVTLKFDTDFDFDSSNAQFIKDELEQDVQDRTAVKGWFKAAVAIESQLV